MNIQREIAALTSRRAMTVTEICNKLHAKSRTVRSFIHQMIDRGHVFERIELHKPVLGCKVAWRYISGEFANRSANGDQARDVLTILMSGYPYETDDWSRDELIEMADLKSPARLGQVVKFIRGTGIEIDREWDSAKHQSFFSIDINNVEQYRAAIDKIIGG